jgi:hypothetical protein
MELKAANVADPELVASFACVCHQQGMHGQQRVSIPTA